MNISLTNEFKEASTDQLLDFMRRPRILVNNADYPDFDHWLQKVYVQLKSEEKRAILIIENGLIIGSVLYQKHASIKDALEIKNLTVGKEYRHRKFGSVLLRQAEILGAAGFKTVKAVCDAKAQNDEVRTFLLSEKYRILGEQDLYNKKSGTDLVYYKNLVTSPGFLQL
ncbi:MAG: hypothetical protein JWM20_474 [Patescibacteria group bacterium]|nr:hypothetical protein [Patescibacteria group bacterium]